MNSRPKRRRDKFNPYALDIIEDEYKLIFCDSKGERQIIKINYELYNEFENFELEDISWMNKFDRHIEHMEKTEESLYHCATRKTKKIDDIVYEKILYEKLHQAIEELPVIQRRRIKMYYFDNLNLREIAQIEKCSERAVKFSIDIGIKKLSSNKNLKKFKI